MASTGAEVLTYLVLTIGVTYALIAFYWEIWRLSGDSPPPDLCVRCGRGLIARVAATSAGVRFYRCAICGARYQRKSRADPWVDASGAEYDEIFSRPEQPGGPGEPMGPPQIGSLDWSRTVRVLLLNKRIRQITRDAGLRGAIKPSFGRRWKAKAVPDLNDSGGVWDSELDG